jgi:hypothetical protein
VCAPIASRHWSKNIAENLPRASLYKTAFVLAHKLREAMA